MNSLRLQFLVKGRAPASGEAHGPHSESIGSLTLPNFLDHLAFWCGFQILSPCLFVRIGHQASTHSGVAQ